MRITATAMTEPALTPLDAARLFTWLSPSFPTGAFAYSHGLEAACAHGLIRGSDGAEAWLRALIRHGSLWNDAVLAAESWRRGANGAGSADLAETAMALAGSGERQEETTAQGTAFLEAARAWPSGEGLRVPDTCPLPVAVGALCGVSGLPLDATLTCYLTATVSNLVQALLRLGLMGQRDGVALLARLESLIGETAARAARADSDDLASATVVSEIMAMRHETQATRIFRT